MIARGITLRDAASAIGISYESARLKVNGRREFKANEIQALSSLLCLSVSDVFSIFFAAQLI